MPRPFQSEPRPFRLEKQSAYPWIFLALVLVVAASIWSFASPTRALELLISSIGAIAAFFYFLYAQHLQETRLFTELFHQFNERYDGLNKRLNAIATQGAETEHSPDDVNTLYDYFNLCAEEYLYFSAGFIDHRVWVSWVRGMKYFAERPQIRTLWQKELTSGSYYGFTLSTVDSVDGK